MEDNTYRNRVFLKNLLEKDDLSSEKLWREHQEMQLRYVLGKGLAPDAVFADIGCGPLRLGVALLPHMTEGWYYGFDINQQTLDAGREILKRHDVNERNVTLVATDEFDFSAIDRPLDMAFSNSLFSHLTWNSITRCLARLRPHLKPGAVYYSTLFLVPDDHEWTQPCPRHKWGRDSFTYDNRDPYHYRLGVIHDLARQLGYAAEIDDSFGHPTQTMFAFRAVD